MMQAVSTKSLARLLIGVVLLAAVAVPSSLESAPRHSSDWDRARCLSRAQVDRVRSDLDYAPALFRSCKRWVREVMRRARIHPNRDRARGVLAMALAHRFAPYGPASGSTYQELAFLPHHECSSYMLLADFIYEAMGGNMERDVLQGWDGGVVGNHAELWVAGVMLDPTVGIAAQIKLNELRRGQPTRRILDLHHFRVAVGQVAPPARDFKDVVWRAVQHGLYRPEDELYTVPSVDGLLDWLRAHAS